MGLVYTSYGPAGGEWLESTLDPNWDLFELPIVGYLYSSDTTPNSVAISFDFNSNKTRIYWFNTTSTLYYNNLENPAVAATSVITIRTSSDTMLSNIFVIGDYAYGLFINTSGYPSPNGIHLIQIDLLTPAKNNLLNVDTTDFYAGMFQYSSSESKFYYVARGLSIITGKPVKFSKSDIDGLNHTTLYSADPVNLSIGQTASYQFQIVHSFKYINGYFYITDFNSAKTYWRLIKTDLSTVWIEISVTPALTTSPTQYFYQPEILVISGLVLRTYQLSVSGTAYIRTDVYDTDLNYILTCQDKLKSSVSVLGVTQLSDNSVIMRDSLNLRNGNIFS
jgi:hypothetical protein